MVPCQGTIHGRDRIEVDRGAQIVLTASAVCAGNLGCACGGSSVRRYSYAKQSRAHTFPQGTPGSMATLSPTLTCSTPGPTAMTMPPDSWPRAVLSVIFQGPSPACFQKCTSEPQTLSVDECHKRSRQCRDCLCNFEPCLHSPGSLNMYQSLALSGKLGLTTDKLELGFVCGLEREVLLEHGGSSSGRHDV